MCVCNNAKFSMATEFFSIFIMWQALYQSVLSLRLASTTADLYPTLSGSKNPHSRVGSKYPFQPYHYGNIDKIWWGAILLHFKTMSVNIMIEFWQWLGCVCIWFLLCTAWSRSVEVKPVLGWCCLFLVTFFSLQGVTVGCTHINKAQISTEKDKHHIWKP